MPIDDGVDFFRLGKVADGEHVVADLRDAHGAAFGWDAVDGVAGVVFARCGMGFKPGVEALAGELADENEGIGDGAVGAVGAGHAMQGYGDLIEIALPIDACGVDELLVLGNARGGLDLLVKEDAERREIEVEDAVGLGQQASGFRRGLGAEEDGYGKQSHHPGND